MKVLAACEESQTVCKAFHESGSWLDDQFEKYTATHWMPIPEPPKGDADANK